MKSAEQTTSNQVRTPDAKARLSSSPVNTGRSCTATLLWSSSFLVSTSGGNDSLDRRQLYGGSTVLFYWAIPYLWTNLWLVLITYLHHTHADVPHYRCFSFNSR